MVDVGVIVQAMTKTLNQRLRSFLNKGQKEVGGRGNAREREKGREKSLHVIPFLFSVSFCINFNIIFVSFPK